MGTRYMDERYDEVARLQAAAWRKVTTESSFTEVEDTAEWVQARQIADQISREEEAAKAIEVAAAKAAKEAAKAELA